MSFRVPRGVYTFHHGVASRGIGSSIVTEEGESLLDLTSGLGVLPLGHGHPAIQEAIIEQFQRLVHYCSHIMLHRPYLELVEMLCEAAPVRGPAKAFLCNSGSEAVEWAVRVARIATGRSSIVAFHGAYHGRTFLASTLTCRAKPYRRGQAFLAPEVYHVPYPYCYRCHLGLHPLECMQACRKELERFFLLERGPEEVAAIIVEPIQGEGGVVVPPQGFLKWLREACDKYGILLVADEVQTGLGRTGPLFAMQSEETKVDLLVVGKALGGGLPLAALVGQSDLMDSVPPSGFGSTFGGNPLACAAGCALLEVLEREVVPDGATRIEALMKETTSSWTHQIPAVGEVRGRGAMWGVELVQDGTTKVPCPSLAREVTKRCREQGLLILSGGLHRNVLRLLPPLNIEVGVLKEALKVIERTIKGII